MNNYTKDDILRIVKEEQVRFIRLQFTDVFGIIKNITITATQLEKVLNDGCMFDGSSIDGFARIEESDMVLMPDPSTFLIFPWTHGDKEARLICDVLTADRKPYEACPRNVLKRAIKRAQDMGYTMNIGPELEFLPLPFE